MAIISYKGYDGRFKYDPDADFYRGEVMLLKDAVTFQGRSLDELKQSLADSVEGYLDTCAKTGREPEKPLCWSLDVRMDPQALQRLAIEAVRKGVPLNDLAADILNKAMEAD